MDRNAPQTARSGSAPGVPVPRLVPLFNPVAKVLLAAGTPMGFNGLITIRGRNSGPPRTTPGGCREKD